MEFLLASPRSVVVDTDEFETAGQSVRIRAYFGDVMREEASEREKEETLKGIATEEKSSYGVVAATGRERKSCWGQEADGSSSYTPSKKVIGNKGQQFVVTKEAPEDYGAPESSPHIQKYPVVMNLLLQLKNGTPQQINTALKQLTDRAGQFDEETKRIALRVVKHCVSIDIVDAEYIRTDILPGFFENFWTRRATLNQRSYNQLVETTVEIANKVGAADVVGKLAVHIIDEWERYRRMVMETIEKIVLNLGAPDFDARSDSLLVDGILYAFEEQTAGDANVMLNGVAVVVSAMGQRVKPHLPQLFRSMEWRLSNTSTKVRQQARDLLSRIDAVLSKFR